MFSIVYQNLSDFSGFINNYADLLGGGWGILEQLLSSRDGFEAYFENIFKFL